MYTLLLLIIYVFFFYIYIYIYTFIIISVFDLLLSTTALVIHIVLGCCTMSHTFIFTFQALHF